MSGPATAQPSGRHQVSWIHCGDMFALGNLGMKLAPATVEELMYHSFPTYGVTFSVDPKEVETRKCHYVPEKALKP